ncbi:MAG: hypothetical protein LBR06_01280 [Bacteroidales bacterium]|jgi:hypothetical protein|nr:hypothetical protein [Bacteroidales bacterium]
MNRAKLLHIIKNDLRELCEIVNDIDGSEVDFAQSKLRAVSRGLELLKEFDVFVQDEGFTGIADVDVDDTPPCHPEEPDDAMSAIFSEPDPVPVAPEYPPMPSTAAELPPDIVASDPFEPADISNDEIPEIVDDLDEEGFEAEPVAEERLATAAAPAPEPEPSVEVDIVIPTPEPVVAVPAPVAVSPEPEVELPSTIPVPAAVSVPVAEIPTPAVTPQPAPAPPPEAPVKPEKKSSLIDLIPKAPEKKTVGDPVDTTPTVNETAKQVNRLAGAIGLNDKFQFIRELFDNDTNLFDTTVEKIDRLDNIQQAVSYLNQNFKWKKNEFSLRFAQLVKRRFSN